MNVPIKGNEDWLKSLKSGDKMYTAAFDSRTSKVTCDCFIFDEYDNKSVKNEGSILANLHHEDTGVKVTAQSIKYGFFPTKVEALEKFRDNMELIYNAAVDAIKNEKENN